MDENNNQSAGQGTAPFAPMPQQRTDGHLWSWLAGMAVLIIVGACIWYGIQRRYAGERASTVQQPATSGAATLSAAQKQTLAMLAKADASLIAPPATDLAPYNANVSAGTPSYYQYSSADGQCSFGFGTRSVSEQGGSSFQEMASLLAVRFRNQGMTVVSNALGAPLVLRDAANPHTQYSLPTEVIAVKSGAESALEYFSVAILKNGNRISITRTCQAAADSVDPAALAPIEAIVQKIAIQLR